MTISTTTDNRVSYSTDGTTTAFAVNFPFLQDGASTHALKVIKLTVADGTEITLTENSDYTVTQSSGDPSTGTVTISPALASGFKLYIIPLLDATQAVNLENSTAINMPTIEKALDKLTLLHQLQQEQLSRAVLLGETTDVTDIVIPTFTGNANKVVNVNPGETGFVYKSVDELVSVSSFDLQTLGASTAIVSTDYAVFADATDSTQYKVTIADFVKAGIAGLTTITETDTTNDKVVIQDATDSTTKLVSIDNLGVGGSPDFSIKQIQVAEKTASESISVTANDPYEDIADLSVSITPTSTDSTIFVCTTLSNGNESSYTITRDEMPVEMGRKSSSTVPNLLGMASATTGSSYITSGLRIFAVDRPKTTSSVTYKVKTSRSVTSTLQINRSVTDTDSTQFCRSYSQIFVIEVFGDVPYAKYDEVESWGTNDLSSSTGRELGRRDTVSYPTLSGTYYNIFFSRMDGYVSSYPFITNLKKSGTEILSPTSPGNRQTFMSGTYNGGSNSNSLMIAEAGATPGYLTHEIFLQSTSSVSGTYQANNSASSITDTTSTGTTSMGVLPLILNKGLTTTPTITNTLGTLSGTASRTTWWDTGISATVTPNSTTDYLLITGNIVVGKDDGSLYGTRMKIQRDGADIFVGDAASNRTRVTQEAVLNSDTHITTYPFAYVVQAGSTAATTISVHLGCDDTSATTLYVNRAHTDTDSTLYRRGVSQLAVFPIKGV